MGETRNSDNSRDTYFKILAETIPHILFIIEPVTFKIKYINHVQPGYELDKVIGSSMFDFVMPGFVDLYKLKVAEVLKTGNPEVIEIVGASAHHSEGKAWYRTHISVIPVNENGTNELMLLSEDITESKIKEFENINKGEKLKAIINNTDDIICSIDRNYKLSEFNVVFARSVKAGFGIDLKIGMPVLNFIDPNKHDHLKKIYDRVLNGESISDLESFATHIGSIVYYETSYHPIINADKIIAGISIFSKNITDRILNEQKLRTALSEKELLLSEIHHRIKNNLAIVSSLLQLQEMNIANLEAREALILSRKRIKSTALIHELLYKSESFSNVNFNDYIKELFGLLRINENIMLQLDGNIIKLDIIKAMPLGLMLNEIMMNSFKHSYKNVQQGKTSIKTEITDNHLIIDYCDCNGNFPEEINFENPTTTGLTLIHTFAQQLDGNIQLLERNPPNYRISIPLYANS